MNERAPATEDLEQAPGSKHQECVEQGTEQLAIAGQPAADHQLINAKHRGNTGQPDGGAGAGTEIGFGRVQQVAGCAQIVNQQQQGHAAEPGAVGFPFEPVQFPGHLLRAQMVFGHFIKATTVYGPKVTLDALSLLPFRRLPKVVVQPDKIERCANPGDAGNHMKPANNQPKPFGEIRLHRVRLLLPSKKGGQVVRLRQGAAREAGRRRQLRQWPGHRPESSGQRAIPADFGRHGVSSP